MKILAIDIGNSKVAAAIIDGPGVVETFEVAGFATSGDVQSQLTSVFDSLARSIEDGKVDGIAVASVVPRALQLFEHLWTSRASTREIPGLVVSHTVGLPFVLDVEHPETVGADRLCNVAGVLALGYDDAVVVDLGTANTFDLLERGCFVGGLIAPGAERSHRALADAGAQLPQIPFDHPKGLVGRNTVDAISSGSFHQAIGGIAYVVERLREDRPLRPVVITGGLAEMLGPELPFEVLFVPQLTLIGAARIASESWNSGSGSLFR